MAYVVAVHEVYAGQSRWFLVPRTPLGGYVFRLTKHTQRFATREDAGIAIACWRRGAMAEHRTYYAYSEDEVKSVIALRDLAEVE